MNNSFTDEDSSNLTFLTNKCGMTLSDKIFKNVESLQDSNILMIDCEASMSACQYEKYLKACKCHMQEYVDGTSVVISSTQKEWDEYNHGKCPYYAAPEPIIFNNVVTAYQNKEICTVTNSHFTKAGWECDLITPSGLKLCGFAAWEIQVI